MLVPEGNGSLWHLWHLWMNHWCTIRFSGSMDSTNPGCPKMRSLTDTDGVPMTYLRSDDRCLEHILEHLWREWGFPKVWGVHALPGVFAAERFPGAVGKRGFISWSGFVQVIPGAADIDVVHFGPGSKGIRYQNISGWWFGTFYIFPYIRNNHPNWLIFFRGFKPPTRYQNHGVGDLGYKFLFVYSWIVVSWWPCAIGDPHSQAHRRRIWGRRLKAQLHGTRSKVLL